MSRQQPQLHSLSFQSKEKTDKIGLFFIFILKKNIIYAIIKGNKKLPKGVEQ
jgi:hypothetical protein